MIKANKISRGILLILSTFLPWWALAARPTTYSYCYQSIDSTELVMMYSRAIVVEQIDSTEIYIVRPWAENHKVEYMYYIIKGRQKSTKGTFYTRNSSCPIMVTLQSTTKGKLTLDLKFDSIGFSDFRLHLTNSKTYE